MPTYDYHCSTCGITFEFMQSMSEAPLQRCPKEVCPLDEGKKGTGAVTRKISAGTSLVFKGSGFYITDYKGTKTSPASDSASTKKENTPTKSDAAAPTSAPPVPPKATKDKP